MTQLLPGATPRRRDSHARLAAILSVLAIGLSLLPVGHTEAQIGSNSSLSLNGTTAYAEAPHGTEFTPTDWTFEVWFKDDNPTYNHPRMRILTKGDITSGEVPFFASIASNVLTVGLRTGGSARILTFNLATGGIAPNAWHHLAATLSASTRQLTVYVDGAPRAQSVLASVSAGNSLPLIVGRSGAGGEYFRGKLDDLRLWNVVRSPAEIQANYQVAFGVAPPGLVGSWKFDEGSGATAADTSGAPQTASLFGNAGWSSDTPGSVVGTSTPTVGLSPTATSSPTTTPSPSTTATNTPALVVSPSATAPETPTSTPVTPSSVTSTATPSPTVSTPLVPGSLSFNGSTAYAEAPDNGALNITGDWTIELWFKDETPGGFNHPRTRMISKGDSNTDPNVPYFLSVESNGLLAGYRSGGTTWSMHYDLRAGAQSPNSWHHVAASLDAATRTVTLYVDGSWVDRRTLGAVSTVGNTRPLNIGRGGASERSWSGKLDDVRVWNVVRTESQIRVNYRTELGGSPPGLVGSWRLDDGSGGIALDSSGSSQNATLLGGPTWSSDTPVGLPPVPAPTPITTGTATATPVPGAGFVCTQIIGFSQTALWFWTAEVVGDESQWQLLHNGGGATRYWADPNYPGWANRLESKCTLSSTTPDRVILNVARDEYTTDVAAVETDIRNAIVTIRGKYPSAREIWLQPVVGGPGEAICPWPGAPFNAVRASYMHPTVDQAINRVTGGTIVQAIDPHVRTCADYEDQIGHLTESAADAIGQGIGEFYASIVSTPIATLSPTPTTPSSPTPSGPTNTPTPTSSPTLTPSMTPIPIPTSTSVPGTAGSLLLNGTSAYAEAPHATELAAASWTIEMWFKDEHPSGYNHPRARLLTKGDITSAEVPFFASISANVLTVGLRSGGSASTSTFNLATAGITPNTWHHLASTFSASTRVLTIYIDATQRRQTTLTFTSAGNALPLIFGRSGSSGEYFRGQAGRRPALESRSHRKRDSGEPRIRARGLPGGSGRELALQ